MAKPCTCCDCPFPKVGVLLRWSGNRDFSGSRDVRTLQGFLDNINHWATYLQERQHETNLLWRIVGKNFRADAEYRSPVGTFMRDAFDGDVLAIGVLRNWLMYAPMFLGHTNSGEQNAHYNGATVFGGHGFHVGYFDEWDWIGEDGSGDWADYELQLGGIRCECGHAVTVNWPASLTCLPEGETDPDKQGIECRTANETEMDARAWAGDILDPHVKIDQHQSAGHACRVEVYTDYDPVRLRSIYDRVAFMAGTEQYSYPISPGLDLYDFDRAKVVFVGRGRRFTTASGVPTPMPMEDMTDNLNDWLDLGGKLLVINGATGYVDSGGDVCFKLNDPWNYQTPIFNNVLSALGSGMSMTGLSIDMATPVGCPLTCPSTYWNASSLPPACLPIAMWSFDYPVTTTDHGIPPYLERSFVEYHFRKTASTHPLMSRLVDIDTKRSATSLAYDAAWSQLPFENVGKISGGDVLLTLDALAWNNGNVPLSSPHTYTTVEFADLPVLAIEQLPSGSWILLSGLPLALPEQLGGYPIIYPDLIKLLPNEALQALLEVESW